MCYYVSDEYKAYLKHTLSSFLKGLCTQDWSWKALECLLVVIGISLAFWVGYKQIVIEEYHERPILTARVSEEVIDNTSRATTTLHLQNIGPGPALNVETYILDFTNVSPAKGEHPVYHTVSRRLNIPPKDEAVKIMSLVIIAPLYSQEPTPDIAACIASTFTQSGLRQSDKYVVFLYDDIYRHHYLSFTHFAPDFPESSFIERIGC